MKSIQDYPLDELKLIYRLLHAQLSEHIALMDSQLMQDLQSDLQAQARKAGVDVSAHQQWTAWLAH